MQLQGRFFLLNEANNMNNVTGVKIIFTKWTIQKGYRLTCIVCVLVKGKPYQFSLLFSCIVVRVRPFTCLTETLSQVASLGRFTFSPNKLLSLSFTLWETESIAYQVATDSGCIFAFQLALVVYQTCPPSFCRGDIMTDAEHVLRSLRPSGGQWCLNWLA